MPSLEAGAGRWPPTEDPAPWLRDMETWADLLEHLRRDNPPNISPRLLSVDSMGNVRIGREPSSSSSMAAGVSAGGRYAWLGWAMGALLLAAIMLLVRALEQFLNKQLYKEGLDLDDPERANDLPPPYSECNNQEGSSGEDDKPAEEPPPPYSACYFSNNKDGVPTVHFTSRRRHARAAASGATAAHAAGTSVVAQVHSEQNERHANQTCEVTISVDVNNEQNTTKEASEIRSEHIDVDVDKPEETVTVAV